MREGGNSLVNVASLSNEIMSGILDRIPNARVMHQRIMNQQTTQTPSQAIVSETSERTIAQRQQTTTTNIGTSNNPVSFNAILDYIANSGQVDNDVLRKAIEAEIDLAATRHNLDPSLVRAVVRAESNYRHDVVSRAGAMGLMQLMPGTAEFLGVEDPFDIRQNIDGGTRYLRMLLDMFDNDLTLALAAYNAGQGNVRRHGGVPPFQETINYIPRVKQFMEEYMLASYKTALEDSRF